MKTIPRHCRPYKKTPTFSESTVPKGLLKAHQTKTGTWGKIVVVSGELIYRILEPKLEVHTLSASFSGIVEPSVLHEVAPNGTVEFYVEFYK